MTVAIIIVLALIVIVLAFQIDREKMLTKVQSSSGKLTERYRIFFSFFINDGFKIKEENKSYVIITMSEPSSRMYLILTQSFNKVLIKWNTTTLTDCININWEFPDSMDQEAMVERVLLEVVDKQQREINKKLGLR